MPIRVLIAEDDQMSREMMVMFAQRQGYDVTAVIDGVELLTVVAKEQFDVIITDLLMTHLDGVSASEMLKLQGIDTPVVAITALSHQDVGHIKNSFARIFHKPCNLKDLFAFIESLPGK